MKCFCFISLYTHSAYKINNCCNITNYTVMSLCFVVNITGYCYDYKHIIQSRNWYGLEQRLYEYKRVVRKRDALALFNCLDHQQCHYMELSWSNILIDQKSNWEKRRIKEAIYIKELYTCKQRKVMTSLWHLWPLTFMIYFSLCVSWFIYSWRRSKSSIVLCLHYCDYNLQESFGNNDVVVAFLC